MSKNYTLLKQIHTECPNPELANILSRLFTRLDKQKIYASSLATSIELVLACRMYDIDAHLILGTIGLPKTKECFPSAWVEIQDNIYDLAIHFDSLRHPMLTEHTQVIQPQINKTYDNADVDYFDFQFVDVFELSDMARHIDTTFKEFCDNSPYGDDLYCDILYAADILQTPNNLKKVQELAAELKILKTRNPIPARSDETEDSGSTQE